MYLNIILTIICLILIIFLVLIIFVFKKVLKKFLEMSKNNPQPNNIQNLGDSFKLLNDIMKNLPRR